MGSWDETWVFRIAHEAFYLLSHLPGPTVDFHHLIEGSRCVCGRIYLYSLGLAQEKQQRKKSIPRKKASKISLTSSRLYQEGRAQTIYSIGDTLLTSR